MKEHRCLKCKKLLFKGNFKGKIEILCPRCKSKVKFDTITKKWYNLFGNDNYAYKVPLIGKYWEFQESQWFFIDSFLNVLGQ